MTKRQKSTRYAKSKLLCYWEVPGLIKYRDLIILAKVDGSTVNGFFSASDK